jgi:hypothetical protein
MICLKDMSTCMTTETRGITFGVVDRLDSGCMYAQNEHEDWQKKRENKCRLHWVVRGGCRQSVVRTEPLYTQKTPKIHLFSVFNVGIYDMKPPINLPIPGINWPCAGSIFGLHLLLVVDHD